ncbi:ankyrin repeat, SAM and basic leucine zipper domain-containing protein 1 [Polypterus senegalus]|uniref:ankyrin repeat, SAM and basic leucine zipper domain-containing protein 1 n=1 Tax=Polypterus senegalus TaxID=55291 RepID=UPI001964D957|nr:ankyrin repeat, SAM and basic leucine zipper domain-containing protein 1 [Polypterus senegalus]
MTQKIEAFAAGLESEESDDDYDIEIFCQSGKQVSKVHSPMKNDEHTLKMALSSGDIGLVESLLNDGMNIESQVVFGWTPLMCAVNASHFELTQLLLDRGANANASKDKYTALMAACTASGLEEKIVKCVELLLLRNADPNVSNNALMTPLMFASRDGYIQVITLLVSHGAELDSQDQRGYTALLYAAHYGKECAVLELLKLGANPLIKTNDGRTAADVAKGGGHVQIFKTLMTQQKTLNVNDDLSKKKMLHSIIHNDNGKVQNIKERCVDQKTLDLECFAESILETDVSISKLLTMTKEDLGEMGITDPEQQNAALALVEKINFEQIEPSKFLDLQNTDQSNEHLLSFLKGLDQQCTSLTDTLYVVVKRFPKSSEEIVLDRDPEKELLLMSDRLVLQYENLYKEMICLRNVIYKTSKKNDPCEVPSSCLYSGRRKWKIAFSWLGVTLLVVLASRMAKCI